MTRMRSLVEEARATSFAHIEFRDTSVGRQAFIKGTRLSVWMLIAITNQYGADVVKIADHLRWTPEQVRAGLNYYAAFRDEIDPVLQKNEAYTFENLTRRLPSVEEFNASGSHHSEPLF